MRKRRGRLLLPSSFSFVGGIFWLVSFIVGGPFTPAADDFLFGIHKVFLQRKSPPPKRKSSPPLKSPQPKATPGHPLAGFFCQRRPFASAIDDFLFGVHIVFLQRKYLPKALPPSRSRSNAPMVFWKLKINCKALFLSLIWEEKCVII